MTIGDFNDLLDPIMDSPGTENWKHYMQDYSMYFALCYRWRWSRKLPQIYQRHKSSQEQSATMHLPQAKLKGKKISNESQPPDGAVTYLC